MCDGFRSHLLIASRTSPPGQPAPGTTSRVSAARIPTVRFTASAAPATSRSAAASASTSSSDNSFAIAAAPASPSARARPPTVVDSRNKPPCRSSRTWPKATASARPNGWSAFTVTPSFGWRTHRRTARPRRSGRARGVFPPNPRGPGGQEAHRTATPPTRPMTTRATGVTTSPPTLSTRWCWRWSPGRASWGASRKSSPSSRIASRSSRPA